MSAGCSQWATPGRWTTLRSRLRLCDLPLTASTLLFSPQRVHIDLRTIELASQPARLRCRQRRCQREEQDRGARNERQDDADHQANQNGEPRQCTTPAHAARLLGIVKALEALARPRRTQLIPKLSGGSIHISMGCSDRASSLRRHDAAAAAPSGPMWRAEQTQRGQTGLHVAAYAPRTVGLSGDGWHPVDQAHMTLTQRYGGTREFRGAADGC
jgi:hypothetical protein